MNYTRATYRSQNGRWGLSANWEGFDSLPVYGKTVILLKDAAWEEAPTLPGCIRQFVAVRCEGSYAYLTRCEDGVKPLNSSAIRMADEDLQGNGNVALLNLVEGAMWIEYGYKSRTRRTVTLVHDEICEGGQL